MSSVKARLSVAVGSESLMKWPRAAEAGAVPDKALQASHERASIPQLPVRGSENGSCHVGAPAEVWIKSLLYMHLFCSPLSAVLLVH